MNDDKFDEVVADDEGYPYSVILIDGKPVEPLDLAVAARGEDKTE